MLFNKVIHHQKMFAAQDVESGRPEEQSEYSGLATAAGAHKSAAGSSRHLKRHILQYPMTAVTKTSLANGTWSYLSAHALSYMTCRDCQAAGLLSSVIDCTTKTRAASMAQQNRQH